MHPMNSWNLLSAAWVRLAPNFWVHNNFCLLLRLYGYGLVPSGSFNFLPVRCISWAVSVQLEMKSLRVLGFLMCVELHWYVHSFQNICEHRTHHVRFSLSYLFEESFNHRIWFYFSFLFYTYWMKLLIFSIFSEEALDHLGHWGEESMLFNLNSGMLFSQRKGDSMMEVSNFLRKFAVVYVAK